MRRLLIPLLTLVTFLSFVRAREAKVSTELVTLFPDSLSILGRALRTFGGFRTDYILLEAENTSDRADATRAVVDALSDLTPYVWGEPPKTLDDEVPSPGVLFARASADQRAELLLRFSTDEMSRRLSDTRALFLAPGGEANFDLLEKDPLGLASVFADPKAPVPDDPSRGVVFWNPESSAYTTGRPVLSEVEARLHPIRKAHPRVTISVGGAHAMSRDMKDLLQGDFVRSGLLSLALVVLVYILLFRRVLAAIAIAVPLTCGTLWTMAIASFYPGGIGGLALAFGSVVLGVGFDTGIHLAGAHERATREGLGTRAGTLARRRTQRPLLFAAFIAALAFLTLATSSIAGLRQLGVLAAVGEIATALAILAFLPWLLSLAPAPLRPSFVPRWFTRATEKLLSTPRRIRWAMLVSSLGTLLFALWFMGLPQEGERLVLIPGMVEAATVEARIAPLHAERKLLLVVEGHSEEDVLRREAELSEACAELQQEGLISQYEALSRTFPPPSLFRSRLAAWEAVRKDSLRQSFDDIADQVGFSREAFASFRESLTRETPYSPPPKSLKDRFIRRDGPGVLGILFVTPRDLAARSTLEHRLGKIDPSARLCHPSDVDDALRRALHAEGPKIVGLVVVALVLGLGLFLRSSSHTLLVLGALGFGGALLLLWMRVFDVPVHVFNVLVLPVLFGIGLDESLFLATSTRGDLHEQAWLALATSLTTASGFFALCICRYAPLFDLGLVGGLGSVAAFLGSFWVMVLGRSEAIGQRTVEK